MLLDERLERHGRASAKFLDQVVRASEDAILVVYRDLSEMLEQERILAARILPARLHAPTELLEAHLFVLDVLPWRISLESKRELRAMSRKLSRAQS